MKHIYPILILILSLSSCNLQKNKSKISQTGKFYPEVEQRSVLIGQITNINDFPNAPKKIELSVNDITIFNQHSFETEINDSGKFVFDVPLYHSINTYLNYGDNRITPYLFPNDTIYLSCQIGKNGFKIGMEEVVFDKKHDKFQNDFKKCHRWLHYGKLNKFHKTLNKELTPQELKNKYLGFEKKLLEEIEIGLKEDPLDDILADYLRFSAKYSIYRQIIRIGKKIEDKVERQDFIDFLTDSIIFDKNAMVTSDYNYFLNAYRFTDKIKDVGKVSARNKEELVTKMIQKSLSRTDGFWTEYLGASTLRSLVLKKPEELSQSQINAYSNFIGNSFEDKYIRQLLLAMCNQTSKKIEIISNRTIPNDANLNKYESITGKKLFKEIIDENVGKVIYIDIWATWCSPCKKQIAHSQRMHEMLKDKNVSFVYLCCRSEEETWKNIIRQFQIKGSHVLLNNEQYNYLKSRFLISGIPRYILIDNSGKIINADAPLPDSEEIIIEINKLLRE